jgi:putative toxin-antitoxin system antitoxin component (TIGR02293 family)
MPQFKVWKPETTSAAKSPGQILWNKVLGEGFALGEPMNTAESEGFHIDVLRNFEAFVPGVTADAPTALGISERTLTRRRGEGRLTAFESDRLYRLISLYALAADVLGGLDAAIEWMRNPALALGNETPLRHARTEGGAKQVATLLARINHGIFT